jgi:methyl-accepting chemotaxis protein
MNQNQNKKYKRSLKNLWLNPQYQGKYIFWISFTGLILVIINSSTFYFFTKENYALLVDLSPMTDEAKMQLYKELKQIIMYLVLGNLLFLIIVSILGLVFSHRTVGPMYHFKRVFREIQNGNLKSRVRLRPKDDFKDVALAFNEMMDSIEKKFEGKNNT